MARLAEPLPPDRNPFHETQQTRHPFPSHSAWGYHDSHSGVPGPYLALKGVRGSLMVASLTWRMEVVHELSLELILHLALPLNGLPLPAYLHSLSCNLLPKSSELPIMPRECISMSSEECHLLLVEVVKTTNPKKYCVRPNIGIVLPRSTCDVIVTMQAQKEMPPNLQCKDKFLVQSVVATPGVTPKDITGEMARPLTSNLTEEKAPAVQQSDAPRQQLELTKHDANKRGFGSASIMFIIGVALLSVVVGYFLKSS
nr:vesicle-associated protein 1-2-like [Ipomoea batatas]